MFFIFIGIKLFKFLFFKIKDAVVKSRELVFLSLEQCCCLAVRVSVLSVAKGHMQAHHGWFTIEDTLFPKLDII